MDYTNEQYALMELLADGVVIYDLTSKQREMISFLDSEKLIQPRVYIRDGYCELSERGKCVLEEHRRKVEAAEVQTHKELDALLERESIRQENVHKEQEKEQKELDRIVRERADRAADRAAEHRFQTRLSFWNTVLGAVLGAFFSNLDRIIPLVASFFN